MPFYVCCHEKDNKEHWFIWSTITDRPATGSGTEADVKDWLERHNKPIRVGRFKRAKTAGCSSIGRTLRDILETNRCGDAIYDSRGSVVGYRYIPIDSILQKVRDTPFNRVPFPFNEVKPKDTKYV